MPGKYSTSIQHLDEMGNEEKSLDITNPTLIVFFILVLIVGYLLYPRFKAANRGEEPPALSSRDQYRFMYIICGGIFIMGLTSGFFPVLFLSGMLLLIIACTQIFPAKDEGGHSIEYLEAVTTANPRYLVYHGYELDFTTKELEKMLFKYLPYYETLDSEQRPIFLRRLRKFIANKNFVIHDTSGFKEMPVLISASAVQLSFGLNKYLLPIFNEIHIYPDEFISSHQSLRIVIGNVSNNCINISWKHFLNGFKYPDGVNVGLHEMAHAYHYQNFAAQQDMDENFMAGYKAFENRSKTALIYELSSLSSLYTLYGLSNEQEFWAESIELFFEKPAQLKVLDAGLFGIIGTTINQGIG